MPIIYTEKMLPDRATNDFYATPHLVIDAAMKRFGQQSARSILDIGAADGRWGIAGAGYATAPLCLVGVDIRPLPQPADYTFWHTLDYTHPLECELMSVKQFDFIISNPPFVVAEVIIWSAWKQLQPGDKMLFLLPADFWYTIGRFNGLWQQLPPIERCSIVKRIPFTGTGNPNNYDLYFWGKDEGGRVIGRENETISTQITF
jgi:hypothetical protein